MRYTTASLCAGLLLSASVLVGQTPAPSAVAEVPAFAGLPGALTWQHPPTQWNVDKDGNLTIAAGKATNWYVSPAGDGDSDNSPRLLFKPANDFVLSAKVAVANHSTWDAGALVLYSSDSVWVKFAIEVSNKGVPTMVSVVTRGISDDNNSIEIKGSMAYLKIAKVGTGISLFESEDGKDWNLIRAFTLGAAPDLRVGFSSQSPVGPGCTSVFSHIQYQAKKVTLWTGE